MILHCVEKDVIKLFLRDIMPRGVFLRVSACVRRFKQSPRRSGFQCFLLLMGDLMEETSAVSFIIHRAFPLCSQTHTNRQRWTYLFCSSLTQELQPRADASSFQQLLLVFADGRETLQSQSRKTEKHGCKWAALRAVVLMIQSAETCCLSLCRP